MGGRPAHVSRLETARLERWRLCGPRHASSRSHRIRRPQALRPASQPAVCANDSTDQHDAESPCSPLPLCCSSHSPSLTSPALLLGFGACRVLVSEFIHHPFTSGPPISTAIWTSSSLIAAVHGRCDCACECCCDCHHDAAVASRALCNCSLAARVELVRHRFHYSQRLVCVRYQVELGTDSWLQLK